MTDFQPKPQTPEQVDQGLRDAFRQAIKDGVMDATPYLKQMTFKSDIEKTEAEIKVLEKKLELLKEIEKYNEGSAREAFKETYGIYPTFPIDVRFGYFKAGYEAAQLKDVGIPECPDEPEYYDEIEHDISENIENKTIRDVIDRWWIDTFTSKNMWSVNECIDDLADQIEFWILRNKNT